MSGRTVASDRLDAMALADALGRAPRLAGLVDDEDTPPGWADLVADLFAAHHTDRTPEVLPAEDVAPSRRLNRAVMARVLVAPELAAARAHTRLDELLSALATMAGSGELRELLDREAERTREIERLEAEAAEREREAGGAGEEEGAAAEGEAADAMERAERAAARQLADIAPGLATVAERAASGAAESARALCAAPGLGPGERRRLSPERLWALAERYLGSERLRRIALLSGRLARDMRAARARDVRGGRGTPVEVVLGDDLSALLPVERMALRVPALRRDALRRLGERRLLCWSRAGEAPGGMGPIVCVVDSSGSMAGERIEWAKALCLALVFLAHRERRDAAVVEFSGGVRSWEFPLRRTRPEDLAEMAEGHMGGGTDTAAGMRRALEVIEGRPPFRAADVVLVTDGEDRFGEEDSAVRARLTELGVRVQGVTVGRGPSEYTEAMCDAQTRVDELLAPSEATRRVARGIARAGSPSYNETAKP